MNCFLLVSYYIVVTLVNIIMILSQHTLYRRMSEPFYNVESVIRLGIGIIGELG